MRPFILQFGKQLPPDRAAPVRYDEARQVSQVLADGCWIDAVDLREATSRATRLTLVLAETTDDE